MEDDPNWLVVKLIRMTRHLASGPLPFLHTRVNILVYFFFYLMLSYRGSDIKTGRRDLDMKVGGASRRGGSDGRYDATADAGAARGAGTEGFWANPFWQGKVHIQVMRNSQVGATNFRAQALPSCKCMDCKSSNRIVPIHPRSLTPLASRSYVLPLFV